MQQAIFGGGCFWCTQAIIKQLKGVSNVVSGYAGGHTEHPTYDSLHREDSGHAEVVRVDYDSSILSYAELLEVFFSIHDPTTLDRQGNDVGPAYRSIILYLDDNQKQIAQEVKNGFASEHWHDPVVTEIKPLDKFWPAEDYHQNFFENNPEQAYCQIVINPKLAKFRQTFADRLK